MAKIGRPAKKGQEYLGFDVNFMRKTKCLRIAAKHGILGRLLCYDMLTWIAEFDACYAEWSEDSPVLFARSVLFDITQAENVQKVVETMLDVGFFSRSAFEMDGILTSKGIVKRWLGVMKKTDRKVNFKNLPPSVVRLAQLAMEEEKPTYSENSQKPEENTRLIGENEEKVPVSPPLIGEKGPKSADLSPLEKKRKETKVNNPPNPPCGGNAGAADFGSFPESDHMLPSPDGLTETQREVVNAWNECFPAGDPRHLNGPPFPVNALFDDRLKNAIDQGITVGQIREAFATLKECPDYSWQIHAAVRPDNLRMLLTERLNRRSRARDKPAANDPHANPANYGNDFFADLVGRRAALCGQ